MPFELICHIKVTRFGFEKIFCQFVIIILVLNIFLNCLTTLFPIAQKIKNFFMFSLNLLYVHDEMYVNDMLKIGNYGNFEFI
jgi:hypothetical protein